MACIRLADGGNAMPHLHTMTARSRAVIRIAAILLLASAAAAADPESLPRPRAKPEPQNLVLPSDAKPKDPQADAGKKEAPPPDGRCDQCGSCAGVRKVGVPKMFEKEITKVCWDARCEDFCIPGPSVWCGKVCKKDDCGCWTHHLWKPTCGEVKTRVVPVRKETKRKVPAVEWKVEERCACCRRKPSELAANPTPPENAATTEKGFEPVENEWFPPARWPSRPAETPPTTNHKPSSPTPLPLPLPAGHPGSTRSLKERKPSSSGAL